MCGLKHYKSTETIQQYLVTPHVGVWIETYSPRAPTALNTVTPHVGVWIETQSHQLAVSDS